MPVMSLDQWCAQDDGSLNSIYILGLTKVLIPYLPVKKKCAIDWPEGGLSPEEIAMTAEHHLLIFY